MQVLMADDDALKDPDSTSPIVSLDEFMESLDSEPPFENLPAESGKAPTSNKDVSEVGIKSKSSDLIPSEKGDVSANKSGKLQSTDAEEEKKLMLKQGPVCLIQNTVKVDLTPSRLIGLPCCRIYLRRFSDELTPSRNSGRAVKTSSLAPAFVNGGGMLHGRPYEHH